MSTVNTLSNALTSGTATSNLGNALSGTKSTTANTSLTNALAGTNSGQSSATTAIADSTSTALQQISDAIQAIGATASANVTEFEKSTRDVQYDNNATARSIGQLRLNSTRLNVISALSPKDAADVFTFNVTNSGPAKFNALVNDPTAKDQKADASGNVRIQIFAKGKGIVADSDKGAGDAYQNYLALKKGTFDLKQGQYSARVSRATGVDPQAKNTYNYALQFSQGTKFTQDYTVTEKAYRPGTDSAFGVAGLNSNSPGTILSDSLADAYSYISSLPSIGTPGSSKLLGFIYTSKS